MLAGKTLGWCSSHPRKHRQLQDRDRVYSSLFRINTFKFAHGYARGEGMKHYVNMVQEPEFAAREEGAGYFDEVTTVIQGGTSSVKALTGSTEEEQFH